MTVATANYALDKQSARSFDADGRMRVRDCVISVAEINPYYGKEIPKAAALGLTPHAVYELYRDPDELARAADSFNGLPLMVKHVVQTADEPRKEYNAGSVYNARFVDGKLRADLLVTDKQAIEYIESGELADLSSAYLYRADMTPLEVGGRKAHGSMRDIAGNHVALVENGRATGAHVADSALSSPTGATTVDPIATPDTSNADVAKALTLLTDKITSIEERLGKVEGKADEEIDETGKVERDVLAIDTDKVDDKDKAGEPRAMDAKSVQAVVDAAVTAERQRASAVETAKQACRHDLGDMIAMDSAPEIYRAALAQRGVDVSALPAGTEQAAYQAIQSVTARPVRHAQDSNPGDKPAFDTSRIRNLGRA